MKIRKYTLKTDCAYKASGARHQMQYDDLSGRVHCHNCGWRNPKDE